MSAEGIQSKLAKKFKATTNSKHNLPVAENLLNRDFSETKPNLKMVSDITYLWTEEGWVIQCRSHRLARTKDRWAFHGERVTKELVSAALKSAYQRSWQTILLQGVPKTAEEIRLCLQHESQRKLLGQCADGSFWG
jgi:putative transposase